MSFKPRNSLRIKNQTPKYVEPLDCICFATNYRITTFITVIVSVHHFTEENHNHMQIGLSKSLMTKETKIKMHIKQNNYHPLSEKILFLFLSLFF